MQMRNGMTGKKNKTGIRTFLLLAGVVLLAAAGVSKEEIRVSAAGTADLSSAKQAVLRAYQNYETRVDVSSYQLYNSRDGEKVNDMMTEIVNETPYLFYSGQQFSKLVVAGSGQIKTLELGYASYFMDSAGNVNVSRIQNTRRKIDAAVNKALKSVNSKMTKTEKALVLHDYLVKNTAYMDDESKEYRLSEWGVFLKGKANCQGYSMAYGILLGKVGIPVKYVTSEEMMHMWNLVKLGGKWYHVDVTWDDPIDPQQKKDQYGLVMHDNFLSSTAKMKRNGYYGFKASAAKSTRYDKKYWNKVTSAFVYRKGKWIYQNNNAILERKNLLTGKAKVLRRAGGRSFIQVNSNRYYFLAYNRIYLYNRKRNSVKMAWDGDSVYGGSYTLTQLKYSSGKIYYRMYRDRKVKSGSRKIRKNGILF